MPSDRNRPSSERPTTYREFTDRNPSARASAKIWVPVDAPPDRARTDRLPPRNRARNRVPTIHDISDPEHQSDASASYQPKSYRAARAPPPPGHYYIKNGVLVKRDPSKGPPNRPWTTATYLGLSSFVLPAFSLAHLYFNHKITWPAYWTCGLSMWTFLQFGLDTMQARAQGWRVPEANLHFLALLGGWPGALLGMHYFQHKTSKPGFYALTATIVLLWEGICASVLFGPHGPSFTWTGTVKPWEIGPVAEPVIERPWSPPSRTWWEKLFDS
ncbi:hypothetical protein MBLNU457_g2993t1 [Dothideomycetes sp. NU457]